VVCEGHAYGLDDGTLTCLDLKNGSVKWKSGRYGYGQLLLKDDILILVSEDGELMLIPATSSKPEVMASAKIFNSGFCWNNLAYSKGKLLLRNANEAVCLDVSDNDAGG
jgi:outer membrane protein assembly factor BamB